MFSEKKQVVFFSGKILLSNYFPPRKRGGTDSRQRIRERIPHALLAAFFLFSNASFSQSYPVQITSILTPPYSGYLPDYADQFNEKLKFIIQLNDFSVPEHTVKLKIKITGNNFTIQSKPFFDGGPVTLNPGVPYLLTGSELAPYLATQHLDFSGINPTDYELRKVLPEGYYSVCITAFDYYNPVETPVSNESCAAAWFILNDPPFLNLPLCGAQVNELNPQQLVFMWSPMNLSSPNSALTTEYDFELYEVRPAGNDPNAVVQTMSPIFTVTTMQPVYVYGISDPPLLTGMEYVWRVRARDTEGRDLFKNNGYSQICTFTWGNILSQFNPDAFSLQLNAQVSSHRQAKLYWNNISNFNEYRLQVRRQGTENWFDYFTSSSQYKVGQLEAQTTYEGRVKGFGSDVESGWSNTCIFTTNPETVINCNDENIPVNPLTAQPLQNAYPGMILSVGQFEMKVTAIYANSQPGFFSGYGEIKVFGVRFTVEYQSIYVDDNFEVKGGKVRVVTTAIDNWISEWEEAGGNNENQFDIPGNIDTIIDTNGNFIIITENGDTIHPGITSDDLPALITDANGDHWVITENGEVIEITEEILAIIKEGVEKLELENNAEKIDELKTLRENELNATQQTISNWLQELELEENDGEESSFSFINDMEEDSLLAENTDDFGQLSKRFTVAQFKMEMAIACRSFARTKTTEEDFLFLAQWLKFNGVNIAEYITEGMETNRPVNVLSDDVKQAIEFMVKEIITKSYTY
ncbi:MAG: fibronectin type III domain-containing protein [Bacteroidota bacterium]